MSNTNMKISKTKILIKNIKKDLNKLKIRDFVNHVLKEYFSTKQIKTMKVLNKIKLLEEKNEKFKGICFLDFETEDLAKKFMSGVVKEEYYS